MAMELRDATEQDRQRCVELLAELQAATGSEAAPDFGSAFTDLLAKERGQIVLAEEDDVLLGMVNVSYNVALRYGGEYCQLEELIVSPAARGRKLGGLLVQTAVDNARTRGCAEMGLYLLKTTEGNQAFYEKYGFEMVGGEMRQRLSALPQVQ